MKFSIVHEIAARRLPDGCIREGRLRLRFDHGVSIARAEALLAALDGMAGIREPGVNPRAGSVFFIYSSTEARDGALSLVAREGASAAKEADKQPGHLPSAPVASGFWPLFRFFVVRPLLPMAGRIFLAALSAAPFLSKGLKALLHGRLNVDVLDASAITASLLMRDFQTVSTLTLLLRLGETLDSWTRRRSLEKLAQNLELKVDNVWILDGQGKEINVPLSQVGPGNILIVRDGSAIPVDGIVEDGYALVNQAAMTGEPLAVAKQKGGAVFAGSLVEEGRIAIRATSVGGQTRMRQIISFIENSEARKAAIESKFQRMADAAVPFTFGVAALVWLLTRNAARAASVLLVDYSCALKLATPLAVLSAMREGTRHGVLIKGGRYLEAASEADTLVFDKTGTLTAAQPEVAEVIAANGRPRRELLRLMACLEEHFPHPVARAVTRKAQAEGLNHEETHAEVRYIAAHGIASTLNGKKLVLGSRHYVEGDEGVDLAPLSGAIASQAALGRSMLFLAIDGVAAGMLAIEDPLRPEAAEVIAELRRLGLERVIMLTGDDSRTAATIAREAGIYEYRAEILPADKARIVEELSKSGKVVMMVGDGINDAPALSAAAVGAAMSDGTDLARGVANILLVEPRLDGLIAARRLGRKTMRRIKINFAAALILNSLFLFGGIFMFLPARISALLHNLTTIALALNAMRRQLPLTSTACSRPAFRQKPWHSAP